MRRLTSITGETWFGPGFALLGALVLSLAASGEEGTVLCPFRRCTGGYCPGCGMTRAGGALVRGNLGASWHHHPFVLLAVGQAMALAALWRFGGSQVRLGLRRSRDAWLVVNAAVVVSIWLVRMSSGQIPVPFG